MKALNQAILVVLLCSGTGPLTAAADHGTSKTAGRSIADPPQAAAATFTEVAAISGISFSHINGASAEKYMPETMGGGGLFFDFDNDGRLDVLLVQGGSIAAPQPHRFPHSLYFNRGDGTFEDRTARAGLHNPAYGMGACAGDIDGDGILDLYFTNVGPNVLYRGRGDGTFTDITLDSGTASPWWSTSCAFTDIDADGDLDLYVANYVDFTRETNKFCGNHVKKLRAYCHPNVYNGQPDALLRNLFSDFCAFVRGATRDEQFRG